MEHKIDYLRRDHASVGHIHIDGKKKGGFSSSLVRILEERGFMMEPIVGHPGVHSFEAIQAMTAKFYDRKLHMKKWEELLEILSASTFIGYAEAESVFARRRVVLKPYTESRSVKEFRILHRPLRGPEFGETRRAKDEFHLTVFEEESDPRAVAKLVELGLYGVIFERPEGRRIAFTMQGQNPQIWGLEKRILDYVNEIGGVSGHIKREHVVALYAKEIDHTYFPNIFEGIENS